MSWIFSSRPSQAALASAESSRSSDEEASRLAAIEVAIDLLASGKYGSVPEGDCPISSKIKELAVRLERDAKATLALDVDLSVNINEAVTRAAEMMRDVHEVDQRSQAIATASEQLVWR